MRNKELLDRAKQAVCREIRRGEHSAWPDAQKELRLQVAFADALRDLLDTELAARCGYPTGSRFTGASTASRKEPAHLIVSRPRRRTTRNGVQL
jgi:hypothetical protein